MHSNGQQNANDIKYEMRKLIGKESLAIINYISVADLDTLEEIKQTNEGALISIAVKIGKTRLIDNITLRSNSKHM